MAETITLERFLSRWRQLIGEKTKNLLKVSVGLIDFFPLWFICLLEEDGWVEEKGNNVESRKTEMERRTKGGGDGRWEGGLRMTEVSEPNDNVFFTPQKLESWRKWEAGRRKVSQRRHSNRRPCCLKSDTRDIKVRDYKA